MKENIIATLKAGFDIQELSKNYEIIQYSGNNSRDGAVLFFMSDNIGETIVVKRPRSATKSQVRSAMLQNALSNQKVPEQLVIPEMYENRLIQFEVQSYVRGKSLKSLMRTPFAIRGAKGFDIGMDLCVLLQEKTSVVISKNRETYFSDSKNSQDNSIPHCLVHNDLAPTNILVKKGRGFLIDWEAADIGPAVYNFFDFIFHFTSIHATGRYSRRSVKAYRSVFSHYSSRPGSEMYVKFKRHLIAFMGTPDAEAACNYFSRFLEYRSTLTNTHLDDIWKQLAQYSSDMQDDLSVVLTDSRY